MNSYTTNLLIADGGKSSSPSFLYLIIPYLLGITIDIIFSQIMGSQYCSFDKMQYTCNIHGVHAQQWQREVVRFILQFGLIMSLLLILQKFSPLTAVPLYTTLFGVIGLVLLFIGQEDLLTDFRRLCNGVVFLIKHN